jgi:signal transduction histidine kinase
VLILLAVAACAALACLWAAGRGSEVVDPRDAELAQVHSRLDMALEASKIGFWDVDLGSGDMAWDDRVCGLFGVPKREGFYSEEDWVAALHPEDRARAVAAANASVALGERFVHDYRVVWPDGQIRHVRDMAAFFEGPDGSRRLMGLVWDITADKAREAELEMRRREAEAADVAKSNFLAAMSHEIRTPLTGVIGMLDLVAAEGLAPAQAERVRIAGASARGLLQLLNDVLDFSRLQAAGVALRPERMRVREVIRGVTDLMAARAQQKGLSLTCVVAEQAPEWVVADPVRLRQVLTNIVSNAIAFTHAGGVAVEAGYAEAEDGGLLTVSVRDTGVGVAEADRARIFERFVQADDSLSRGSGGAGLGLAIARELVELMGGTISLESAPGRGSTFRFTARVGRAPDAPGWAESGKAPGAVSPLRILVAEDNATNQHLIKALLAPGGHRVTVVANGREAVRAVARARSTWCSWTSRCRRWTAPPRRRPSAACRGPRRASPSWR